ncbi:unnamed protein product, partial [Mesorhabditis spiculigera]
MVLLISTYVSPTIFSFIFPFEATRRDSRAHSRKACNRKQLAASDRPTRSISLIHALTPPARSSQLKNLLTLHNPPAGYLLRNVVMAALKSSRTQLTMLPNEGFQKLLHDLFCLWHDVRRHYDPPLTDSEEEKKAKIKAMICRLLSEIDGRVQRIKTNMNAQPRDQAFYEEWTMLTWNVLCITSRLQNSLQAMVTTADDRAILDRLNQALVELVNYARQALHLLKDTMDNTMVQLHQLYRLMNTTQFVGPADLEQFHRELTGFQEGSLNPCIEMFKKYCNRNCERLWRDVRAAQVMRMRDQVDPENDSINELVAFYSNMMFILAILGARLQGFRYDLTISKKMYGSFDPVQPLSEAVFAALDLLMSDCVLATEPSTNAILVTNNLFSMNVGALARGVVFKDFEIQVVSEEIAEIIQNEMRRARLLQGAPNIGIPASAALLAMKPTSGTKRHQSNSGLNDQPNNTAHKKSDVNSKENVTIYPIYNAKNRYWAASYPHLLCTTRQKGKASSNHNSYQDLSPSGVYEKTSNGKRPLFYFHIKATLFSPSGRFSTAHTLSLPFTIATRRNQDCQVQRMMSSYTATIFWLYGCHLQDGLLLQWSDQGMLWGKFVQLYKQHFKTNAGVNRGLIDQDFELLQYKLQCQDCQSGDSSARINGAQQIVTFKNILCPHLRYECGSTNVRFSVWRGMLELLQIFHDGRNNVRNLWEMGFLLGFLEFDQVDQLLEKRQSTLIMRLSFVTGGTICFTLKSNAHAVDAGVMKPIHLEPLDLKKLQAKCLMDYLRDIADAEKVKYIMNSQLELVRITDVLRLMKEKKGNSQAPDNGEDSRQISSNVTHSGDLDAMQNIRFTAMRIAVVTCKVKPPSADLMLHEVENERPNLAGRLSALLSPHDDFARELVQLCNFHGKGKQEAMNILDSVADQYFSPHNPSAPSSIGTPYTSYTRGSTPMMESPHTNGILHSFEDMDHTGFKYDHGSYS